MSDTIPISTMEKLTKLREELKMNDESFRQMLTKSMGIPAPETEKDAATYLAEQAELQQHPWKRVVKDAELFWSNAGKLTDEELKRKFELMAKKKQLTPMVVIVCLYTLYVPDKEFGRRLLMELLLFGPQDRTLTYHNYQVYVTLSASDKLLFGEILEWCPVPLYPACSELSHLNDEVRIITKRSQTVGGGEALPEVVGYRHLYAEEKVAVLEGGYTEPIYNGQGEQIAAVDLTHTESLLAQVHGAVQQLAAMAASRDRGRGRGRGYANGRGYSNPRGRGGSGPWTYRGGADTQEQSPKN